MNTETNTVPGSWGYDLWKHLQDEHKLTLTGTELHEIVLRVERLQTGGKCVLQPWVLGLPMMQQTVLLTAVRGPDGSPKYGPVKMLLRWYRRCVLLSALDGAVLASPYDDGGGSFTGPSCKLTDCAAGETEGGRWVSWSPPMMSLVDDYLRALDALPHHFQLHLMHAIEILGYKHPDAGIASFWASTYIRLVNDMHLHPETEEEMDGRLGDSREGWLARADAATVG